MLRSTVKKLAYGINKKIFFFFSLSSLLLIIILSIIISFFVGRQLREQENYYTRSISQQLSNNLDLYVEDMKNTIMVVSFNNNIGSILYTEHMSEIEKYESFKNFNNAITSIMSPKKYNELFLIVPDRRYILSTNAQNTIDNYDISKLAKKDWYIKMTTSKNSFTMLNDFEPLFGSEKVSFAIALNISKIKPDYNYYDCYIIISSFESYFDDILKGVSGNPIDFFVITDNDGNILYNTRKIHSAAETKGFHQKIKSILGSISSYDVISYSGKEYFFNVNTSRNSYWKVIFFSSQDKLKKRLNSINLVILSITVLISAVMLILSFYISSGVTNPVKKLTKLMKEVENNNLDVSLNISNNDEIGDLSRSFNNMVRRINVLVNEILEGQLLRKEAEIFALQQQINPHFLYNTLEAINSLSIKGRTDDIRTVVQRMGSILQYCINRKRHEFAKLGDEIQHVKNYMVIQGIRFSDRIRIVYDLDDRLYDTWTLKFILQPIVENAFKHGFTEGSEAGIIKITGCLDRGDVVIEVEDNGKGIGEDELRQLNEYIGSDNRNDERERMSIGLRNVHARLSLTFKGDYGLKIESVLNAGTKVTIRYPEIDERGERSGVEGSCS